MNWLIKTLGSAMVAGFGWKFGVDIYETVKAAAKTKAADDGDEIEDEQAAENGAAATQTDVVDTNDSAPSNAYRW